ncbi:MAG: AgmX/PglI C-terminal domain-containing protein [Polyangiaceae bacterium]|nr:AgmX/PglI C-terminal domain-containing protein [Polyangiaceae bacterium]
MSLLLGCSSAPSPGGGRAPEYAPKGEVKCGVTKSQAEPLIVEWPSAARGKLETQARKGLVAVRYVGCEMEVLAGCHAPGGYQYAPMTRKRDRLSIRNEDDLYASIPVYAASFEGKLRSAGELNVTMTLVGRYESDRQRVRRDELRGEGCEAATHVITALTAGAFKFFAGADAEAGAGAIVAGVGAGARTASAQEVLREDGTDTDCEKATRSDREPPEGCGALLRVEVVPLGDAKPEPAAAPVAASAPAAAAASAPAAAPAAASEPAAAPAPQPSLPETISEGNLDATGGIDRAEVNRILRATLTGAKACYDKGRSRNPRLAGRVNIHLTIGPAGEVQEVPTAGSSLPDAAVQRCILSLINASTFPSPSSGKAVVDYPITFTPPPPPRSTGATDL